jgi:hypothetical protein
MLKENLDFAESFLNAALEDYEGNGNRYEPADRQKLIDLINQLDLLNKRMTNYLANLPFVDHQPIDTEVSASAHPQLLSDLFKILDNDQYICPKGPLSHSEAYVEIKNIFQNTRLNAAQAQLLLQKARSN